MVTNGRARLTICCLRRIWARRYRVWTSAWATLIEQDVFLDHAVVLPAGDGGENVVNDLPADGMTVPPGRFSGWLKVPLRLPIATAWRRECEDPDAGVSRWRTAADVMNEMEKTSSRPRSASSL
jgi:hypothetical protein